MILVKEIKSKDGVLHFRRYRIIETRWFSVYVHVIYKADEDLHMHDHPWNYTSIGLYGYFSEDTPAGNISVKNRIIHPLKVVCRKAEQPHKIKALFSDKVVTLFITGRRFREWGYHTENGWVDHKTYRENKRKNKI